MKKSDKKFSAQQIDSDWYKGYKVYYNDSDVENDKMLYDIACRKKHVIHFTFIVLREDPFNKVCNFIRKKFRILLNHPSGGTVGMRITKCKPAMISLLNELTEKIGKVMGTTKPFRLQINSILRTVTHQKHIARLGYYAPLTSSHTIGYAADIEQKWYFLKNKKIFEKILTILSDYHSRNILNLIDDGKIWHICLNPAFINHYEKLSKYWLIKPKENL